MTPGSKPVVVLVADGDELVRMVTADMLIDAGYDAIEVRSAAEALAVLDDRAAVRLLITARRLAGPDGGIQLAHLVRARWPGIGIIVTAGSTIDVERELPPGTRLLRKPYEFADLMRAVEAELDDAASALPMVPDGIPLGTTTQPGGGIGALAAPATEPDKT